MRAAACLALILAFSSSAPAEDPPVKRDLPELLNKSYIRADFWDDRKAEVATYKASRIVLGKPREHEVKMITVQEDFTTEYYTKADWPYGQKPITAVIKQNTVGEISTPSHPLRFMTSVFVNREQFGETMKIVVSTQDWSGASFKEFQLWKDKPSEIFHSYSDGEGTGTRELPGDLADYYEEELPLVLRALPFEEGLEASFWLYPGQTSNRAPEPKPVPASLTVSAGNKTWVVAVKTGDNRDIRYEFQEEYPFVLQSMEHSDGRTMKLESVSRYAFWIQEE